MRSPSLVPFAALLFAGLAACDVSTTANSITFKSKPEFVDSSQPAKTSVADWNGEPIAISNAGVNPLIGDGGVRVTVDPNATKITVSAVFAARANEESEAQDSIRDAIGTLAIDESGGQFKISCGHGGAHGSSDVAASGCKLLNVTIPAGSADKPLDLTIGNGMGNLTFSGAVTVSKLLVDNNGTGGVVDVKVIPVKGASVTVTGEDVVSVAVPADFSAESVILTVDESDPTAAAARIVTSDFAGMESNQPFPTTGATENAAASLNVQSKGVFDDDTVTIKKL